VAKATASEPSDPPESVSESRSRPTFADSLLKEAFRRHGEELRELEERPRGYNPERMAAVLRALAWLVGLQGGQMIKGVAWTWMRRQDWTALFSPDWTEWTVRRPWEDLKRLGLVEDFKLGTGTRRRGKMMRPRFREIAAFLQVHRVIVPRWVIDGAAAEAAAQPHTLFDAARQDDVTTSSSSGTGSWEGLLSRVGVSNPTCSSQAAIARKAAEEPARIRESQRESARELLRRLAELYPEAAGDLRAASTSLRFHSNTPQRRLPAQTAPQTTAIEDNSPRNVPRRRRKRRRRTRDALPTATATAMTVAIADRGWAAPSRRALMERCADVEHVHGPQQGLRLARETVDAVAGIQDARDPTGYLMRMLEIPQALQGFVHRRRRANKQMEHASRSSSADFDDPPDPGGYY